MIKNSRGTSVDLYKIPDNSAIYNSAITNDDFHHIIIIIK